VPIGCRTRLYADGSKFHDLAIICRTTCRVQPNPRRVCENSLFWDGAEAQFDHSAVLRGRAGCQQQNVMWDDYARRKYVTRQVAAY
jgi:hypothetical protein